MGMISVCKGQFPSPGLGRGRGFGEGQTRGQGDKGKRGKGICLTLTSPYLPPPQHPAPDTRNLPGDDGLAVLPGSNLAVEALGVIFE